ncbi:MAG: DUF5309 family protein [Pseudodesulfovibrio sp.]|uniref:SU10 major capsid protein n=1 Tax=Pseudodesulfovibrio sp. TaxID=2035812 RepID=UPI003D0A50BA
MAQATTYSVVNYDGRIFKLLRKNLALLKAIGALRNGSIVPVSSPFFENTIYDNSAAAAQKSNLEGQDASKNTLTTRDNVVNVLEIFHEDVNVSYTKSAAVGQMASDSVGNRSSVGAELPFQLMGAVDGFMEQVSKAFLYGEYAVGSDSTPRRTRGLLPSITTNVVVANAGSGAADSFSRDYFEEMVLAWFANGGSLTGNAVILTSGLQKLWIDRIYGKPEENRTIAGTNLQVVSTPLGDFPIMIDHHMPTDVISIANLDMLQVKGLYIPKKGIIFEEELAKTGASDKTQLYGELGLDSGDETAHAKLTNLVTTRPTD